MKTKCLLCTTITEPGNEFYDHLEDIHFVPIRRMRINESGVPIEETHDQCLERFKFNHPEFGTDKCWCPDCIGGETSKIITEVSKKYGTTIITVKH